MTGRYRIADVPIEVTCREDYIARQCRGWETDDAPELTFTVTDADIAAERAMADAEGYPDGYLSSLALYRQFSVALAPRGYLLFHSSAVAVDGRAYLFTAPSGTGKSTHVRLWRELLGERAVMINDDKPLLRVTDDEIRVYGTPWNGKHRLGSNLSAPVGAICFLFRSEKNVISRLPAPLVLPKLLSQTFRPEDPEAMRTVLETLVSLSSRLPVWQLGCNISEEAAALSFSTLSGAAAPGGQAENIKS